MGDLLRRHPLVAIILAGLGLRLLAAATGYGVYAADDYRWVVEPAHRWLSQPELPFLSDYRSVLLPRIFWLLLEGAQWLGAEDPRVALRLAYGALGLFSLLTIPGAYYLARRSGERVAILAAALVAAQALMPRITTRALIEVVAMAPLVWALVCAENAGQGSWRRRLLWAAATGLLLGLASMFRFQVGVIFIAFFLAWALRAGAARRGIAVAGLMLGGLGPLLAQGFLDLATHGAFLAAPFGYLRYNLEYSSQFGVSAWYTYLFFFVALSVPPATFALARPFARAFRRHRHAALAFVAFLVVHSAIGHKEERFMYPILPLFFVLMAEALEGAWRGGRWSRRAVKLFVGANLVLLPIVCVSDGQRNVTVPLGELGRREARPVAVGVRLRLPTYYLGKHGHTYRVESLEELAKRLGAGEPRPHRILFREPPAGDWQGRLQKSGLWCDEPLRYEGDIADRLVVWLNPKGNRRRAARYVSDCR